MLKPRGGIQTLSLKIRKITKKFDGDIQKIRGDLILDLKVLAELAHDQATKIEKVGRPTKEHRNWARLAAYISQTINSIAITGIQNLSHSLTTPSKLNSLMLALLSDKPINQLLMPQ